MNEIKKCADCRNPLIIGINGCSRSGKTTLARQLADQYNNAPLVRLDRHFRVKELHSGALDCVGYPNWECPESLDYDACYKELEKIFLDKTEFCPKHKNFQGKDTTSTEQKAEQTGEEKTAEIILIEGFLIFPSDKLWDAMDRKLFLSISQMEAFTRRMRTKRVPVPYFNTILWPEYIKHNQRILLADQDTIGQVYVIDSETNSVEEIFTKIVEDDVLECPKEKYDKLCEQSHVLGIPMLLAHRSSKTSHVDSKKPMCNYGAKCYRSNPQHFQDFQHPAEHPRPGNVASGKPSTDKKSPRKKPTCRHGKNCYRTGQEHTRKYSHP